MKKLKIGKGLATVGISLVCGAFLITVDGCGGLGIPNLGQIFPQGGGSNLIVGTWKTQSISDGTNTANCPGTLTDNQGSFNCEQEVRSYLITGDWVTTAPADLVNQGTWVITNNNLTVTSNNTSFSGAISFSSDGKTLYWNVNGITTTATKQ